ncbi:hypothetical protein GCM10010425_69290 [Streptomyces spororaveus]|uniref:Uncharacterized protein n=1 Tax=Streptomyces spororaveus TaxID=284039 RepID=A0ABQ3TLW2_9ACTN|nr:hypothetical protein Sspor_69700 [Streptomyces spororaveus]
MSSADALPEPLPTGLPDVHLAPVAPGLAHAERHAGILKRRSGPGRPASPPRRTATDT